MPGGDLAALVHVIKGSGLGGCGFVIPCRRHPVQHPIVFRVTEEFTSVSTEVIIGGLVFLVRGAVTFEFIRKTSHEKIIQNDTQLLQ